MHKSRRMQHVYILEVCTQTIKMRCAHIDNTSHTMISMLEGNLKYFLSQGCLLNALLRLRP